MKHLNKFTYEDALAFIHGSLKLGSKLGLSLIRELLRRLGNPEAGLRFVHIAGTNGKGTVTTSLAAALCAAGYRTGAYTSPFVYRFNERIQIDGLAVSDALLTTQTEKVKHACAEMTADGFAHPTEFEIVTAVAFLCYAAANCDIVALEVGLGGRLDATNVITNPLCTAICRIGYDHMQYLGNTIEEITAEKCGILKEGVPCVSYREQSPKALKVITAACAEKNVPLSMAPAETVLESTYCGSSFLTDRTEALFLPLAGVHMVKNACVTLGIIEVLRMQGMEISEEAVRTGFSKVVHRGRLETISENPLFVLDGAHNDDGILALCDAIQTIFAKKKLVLICGMLADKEYEKAMQRVGGLASSLITVTVPSPRALSAEALCAAAAPYQKKVQAAESITAAVEMAYKEKPEVIIAFGSLYMLGDVYEAQKKYEATERSKRCE